MRYNFANAVNCVLTALAPDDSDAANAQLLAAMRTAQHFHCDDAVAERLTDDHPVVRATELRLPFPDVYLEMEKTPLSTVTKLGFFFHRHIILVSPEDLSGADPETVLWGGTMVLFHVDGSPQLVATTTVFSDGQQFMQTQGGNDPHAPDRLEEVIQSEFARAIVVLNATTEGILTQYTPSQFRKPSRKRKIEHKLLEYKVLRLDLKRLEERKEAGAGHHASPRLHVRRGHWRNYKTGDRKWISPMWVGDKEAGMVVKDYELII
jgi:hypothetical protein